VKLGAMVAAQGIFSLDPLMHCAHVTLHPMQKVTSSGIMTSGTLASNTTLAASGSVCICVG
jgi:hypothetical protein